MKSDGEPRSWARQLQSCNPNMLVTTYCLWEMCNDLCKDFRFSRWVTFISPCLSHGDDHVMLSVPFSYLQRFLLAQCRTYRQRHSAVTSLCLLQVSGRQRERQWKCSTGPEVPSKVERAPELRGSAGVWIQRGHGWHQPLPSTPFRGEGGHQRQAKYEAQFDTLLFFLSLISAFSSCSVHSGQKV